MSESRVDIARPDTGKIVMGWWKQHLRPEEETGPQRGFRARLRRAGGTVDALAGPWVVELYDKLGRGTDPVRLAALAQVLAEVRDHSGQRIAQALGRGDPKVLSSLRFQRLIHCEDPAELSLALRRALPLIGHACNVAALAEDFLNWGEKPRIRWCFDYYGAAPPVAAGAGQGSDMEDDA